MYVFRKWKKTKLKSSKTTAATIQLVAEFIIFVCRLSASIASQLMIFGAKFEFPNTNSNFALKYSIGYFLTGLKFYEMNNLEFANNNKDFLFTAEKEVLTKFCLFF